jgi:diphosphomevalonate decarboxylase
LGGSREKGVKIEHMKAMAKSPANIAFIKFWGKRDRKLNLPFNDSISMNLSECFTKATVDFQEKLREDLININGVEVDGEKKQRVVNFLNAIRKLAKIKTFANVDSENNFPADSGIASSASAFSALALAGSRAAGLNLGQMEVSRLARLGSGSASRSVIDGFAYWKKGRDDESSYSIQLAKTDFWDIRDIVAVVSKESKKISTTEGHEEVLSSPYFKTRIRNIKNRIKEMKSAMLDKNFTKFGELMEEEAVDLHVITMTSKPPIFYWNAGTLQIIRKLQEWREEGLLAYFTIDAGPNVHVICQSKDEEEINERLKKLSLVKFTIVNKVCEGTKLV